MAGVSDQWREEVWLDIVGFENRYEVSNLGRIRSIKTGNELVPAYTHGYGHVTLLKADGTRHSVRVHVAVLTAFCGRPPFEGAQSAHNNGDQLDCRLVNLRWASPKENQDDVTRHGNRYEGERVHNAKLKASDIPGIRTRIKNGERYETIAEDHGVSISTVSLIFRNKIWKHVL